MSGTVFDPPASLFVLGYVWHKGSASGGRQVTFVTQAGLRRGVQDLIDKDEVEEGKIKAWRLDVAEAVPLTITWPQDVAVGE